MHTSGAQGLKSTRPPGKMYTQGAGAPLISYTEYYYTDLRLEFKGCSGNGKFELYSQEESRLCNWKTILLTLLA